MLTEAQSAELRTLVDASLDQAERVWNRVGHELKNENLIKASGALFEAAKQVPSEIPGHPFVEFDKPVVDEFIAMVVDIRDSTGHLQQALSNRRSTISQLQRIYYESSALLPAVASAVRDKTGRVTEYLGDGVLGLFPVSKADRAEAVYASYGAAKNSVLAVQDIINPKLIDSCIIQ